MNGRPSAACERLLSSEPCGPARFSLSVYGSTTSIEVMPVTNARAWDLLSFIRSRLYLATSAFQSVPSWNFTPWRSLNVAVLPSSCHSVASSGSAFMLPSAWIVQRTSVLYRRFWDGGVPVERCGSNVWVGFWWPITSAPPRLTLPAAAGFAAAAGLAASVGLAAAAGAAGAVVAAAAGAAVVAAGAAGLAASVGLAAGAVVGAGAAACWPQAASSAALPETAMN